MRKKAILLLLLLLPVLFVATACGKKEEKKESNTKTIELKDEKLKFKTTFTVSKDSNFTDIEVDEDSGASAVLTFKNEDLDIGFEMYYNKMRTATFEASQNGRKDKKYYKEYQFGDCEAYAYGDYDDNLYLNIILKRENNDDVDVLFVSIDRLDTNKDVIVSDIVKGKELQKLFNSIKFEKINNE